jgi:hypothetical protein
MAVASAGVSSRINKGVVGIKSLDSGEKGGAECLSFFIRQQLHLDFG